MPNGRKSAGTTRRRRTSINKHLVPGIGGLNDGNTVPTFNVKLGDMAVDPVTGFKGRVIGELKYLDGYTHFLVQPKTVGNKMLAAQSFDAPRLKKIGRGAGRGIGRGMTRARRGGVKSSTRMPTVPLGRRTGGAGPT